MNSPCRSPRVDAPWALTFSFARAIQQPALTIWADKGANRDEAQRALLHRAQCNLAARAGLYSQATEESLDDGSERGSRRSNPNSEGLLFPSRRNCVVARPKTYWSNRPSADRAWRRPSARTEALGGSLHILARALEPAFTRKADLRTRGRRGKRGNIARSGRVGLWRL